jgi:hypothetical protein
MIRLINYEEKKKKNGGSYLQVAGLENVNGSDEMRTYICNYEPAISMIRGANQGDQLDLISKATGDGKYFLNAKKGAPPAPTYQQPIPTQSPTQAPTQSAQTTQPASDKANAFACSYAKDIMVALYSKQNIPFTEAMAIFTQWFGLFKIAIDTGLPEYVDEVQSSLVVAEVLKVFEGSKIVKGA